MLIRVAPSRYRGQAGETVRIAAVPQNNADVSFAVFRYGNQVLPTVPVQGHPGCQFVVGDGAVMFGTIVTFAPNAPNARYDLFEEVNGTLSDLQFPVEALFGPAAQFQIDGVPVAVLAGAPVRTKAKKKAALRKAKKTRTTKKAKKKAARRKPVPATRTTASRSARSRGRATTKSGRTTRARSRRR
jgi:hypothetical protein